MESATNSNSSFSEPLVCSVEFKSGAVYQGAIAGGKRSGRGAFTWPSGLHYNGQFKNNQRHGNGQQVWPDGSRYEGKFRRDVRHGSGKHEWKNGECYEGEYCSDLKHGRGSYRWSNGATFTGEFKGDIREGEGVFIDAEGNRFEGLYCNDIRDGEGILTYTGGRQDMGVWKGTKLVQLTCSISDAIFIPRLKLLFHDISGISLPETKRKSNSKGFLEMASEELIHAAVANDVHKAASILKAGAVHVDVCEKAGHTPLFAAAIHCHPDVMHLLLHNGADVNAVNAMGVSILTACHHLLYSHHPRVQALLRLLPTHLFAPGGGKEGAPTQDSSTASEHSIHSSSLLSTILDDNSTLEEETDTEKLGTDERVPGVEHHAGLLVCEEYPNESPSGPSCTPGFKSRRSSTVNTTEEECKTNSYPFLEAQQEKKVHFVYEEDEEEGEEEEEEEEKLEKEQGESEGDDARLSNCKGDNLSLRRKDGPHDPTTSNNGPSKTVNISKHNLGNAPILTLSTNCSTSPHNGWEIHQSPSGSEVSNVVDKKSIQSPNRGTNAPVAGSPLQGNVPRIGPVPPPHLQDTNLLMLKKAGLHSSSVFSSTAYGPIVSAAQSTIILSTSAVSLAKRNPTPSQADEPVESQTPQPQSVENTIDILLQRGADPNISDIPLPSIVYAICAGDVRGVTRLLAKGARVHSSLPSELGVNSLLELALMSHEDQSPSIVEALLKYGANPNLPSGQQHMPCDQVDTLQCGTTDLVGGENQGTSSPSPLHLLCSADDIKQDVIVEKVRMLLDHGADVNKVANGHSPLSLAIVRGYDQVADLLLKGGANPNVPLGKGVCSAICCLTLHAALKRRDLQSSMALLDKLIGHKADILLPIRVWDNWSPGTAADFAHEAFKQDKRLANIKYDSLNKSERLRYKASKKLTQQIILLLRARAADSTNSSEKKSIEADKHNSLPVVSGVVYRNVDHKRSVSANPPHEQPFNQQAPRRKACSALPGCRMSAQDTSLPSVPSLSAKTTGEMQPLHRQLSKTHGRQGPLLDQRPITAFTYPPATTTTITATPTSQDVPATYHTKKWDFFSFCYECGRSSGVRLTKCPICKAVCYCSIWCRETSWKTDHRETCVSWRGPSGSSGLGRKSTAKGSRRGYGSTPVPIKLLRATPMLVWLPNSLEPLSLSTAFPEEEKFGPDC